MAGGGSGLCLDPPGVPAGISTAEAAFTLDGKAQTALNGALLSCVVEENTNGLYRCEARFGNWKSQGSSMDYAYFDRRTLDRRQARQERAEHPRGLRRR